MERIGVRLDPDRLAGSLSIGERQRVEIVKALVHDCRVLILDEPTAVLTPQDIRALFATIRRLQESGMGVLLVSHKLKEVAEISDRVVVLRRGRLVGERRTAEVTPTELANLMMGVAEVSDADTAAAVGLGVSADTEERTSTGEQVLGIRDLVVVRDGRRMLDGLTLDVAAGEIVGLAGISGNGQTELVDALCGRRSVTDGAIEVAGRDITTLPVADRLAAGLGRLTEDRRGSVVAHLTVEQNLVLEDLGSFTRRGLLDRAAVRRHAEARIERFEIKATPTTPVGTLSGGNIQKVLLARTLHRAPRALVAAQPTRGLDVGAYRYVHQQLTELRASGAGVLLISEDLDELRALSDRIVVLLGGRLVGEVAAAEATNDRLGLLMTGQDVA
jgi:simple sugar transport system ATP-binding protein